MNPVEGLPARVQHRVIVALVVMVVAISSAPAVHGQSSRMPVTTSRVGAQSAGSSSGAQVSRSAATLGGTVSGVIFWDEGRVAYNPSVPCQALQLELDAITGTGTQKLAVLNQFEPKQPVRSGPGLRICNYSFSHVPEGVALLMQLSVGLPFSTQVIAKGPFPLNGTATTLIKVPGGQCNNPPSGTTSSSTYLESGWVGCGDHTYNVNFQLLTRGAAAPLAPRPSMLLQQTPGSNTPSQPMLLQPSSQPGPAAPTNGMLMPTAKPVERAPGWPSTAASANGSLAGGTRPGSTVQLNPQPLPPKGAPAGGFAGGMMAGGAAPSSSSIVGGKTAPSALIGLLRTQGSLKVISGNRTRYALNVTVARVGQFGQQRGAGQISAGQTMAARTTMASRVPTSPIIVPHVRIAYIPSDLLSQQENAWCEQQEAKGAAPAILRIDGKTAGINYSPDPQTNPYTFVGCGFGNSTGSVVLRAGGQEQFLQGALRFIPYIVTFNVQSWTDHEIVAAVEPTTSGVPDCTASCALVVTTNSRPERGGQDFSGQFTALRKTQLLTSIPQNESSLYQAGSPYFVSPVSNYYGLDGTVAVMRQGLSGPVAGQDQFTLKLAPGFAVDSTQTDLLVSDTNFNVTSQPATVNGNTITVTYPVVSVQSGNSTVYYSIYGLKVWVTGPAGLNPIAP